VKLVTLFYYNNKTREIDIDGECSTDEKFQDILAKYWRRRRSLGQLRRMLTCITGKYVSRIGWA
jgi:hypothetical protein